MKLSRVLLDGDLFDNTIGKSQVNQYRRGTWLIRHNEYRILVEGRGSKTSDNRMYDVTIYNTKLHTCKHCIIWKHFVDRFKQRCAKTNVWYRICLLLIHDKDYKFSTTTNRQYIKANDKYSFALAYDMTEDGIMIYKTFFIKDNEHCVLYPDYSDLMDRLIKDAWELLLRPKSHSNNKGILELVYNNLEH